MDLKDIGIAFKAENNEASDGTSGLSANVQTAEVCLHNFCALFVYKLLYYVKIELAWFFKEKRGECRFKESVERGGGGEGACNTLWNANW